MNNCKTCGVDQERLGCFCEDSQKERDAADAAKWRAVEPLLREWTEAEAARKVAFSGAGPLTDELMRLRCLEVKRLVAVINHLRSATATDVNRGLTTEPQ